MNCFDVLNNRGFVAQCTHEEELKSALEKEQVTFYIGIDPTADSLTIGHFLTIMAASHLQKMGHKPIFIVGGGTGMIGDPSDRTEMRRLMTTEEVDKNVNNFKKQLSNFIDFSEGEAIILNNGDWLRSLNYIDFIREFGVHFSVNRMLTADCYKSRLDEGLSFFEFNYMIMQSYDFLYLNQKYNCTLQLGGNDQWSNIIGGIELIRRVEQKNSYGLTLTLLTDGNGKKMGKSLGNAVWLDENKTSPFEFFQYFRNVDDSTVIKMLKLLTFLPMEKIEALEKLEGKEINTAKETLAFEITKNVHGEENAKKALEAARSLFSGNQNSDNIKTFEFEESEIEKGIGLLNLLTQTQLVKTNSEGRRAVTDGGVKINNNKITDPQFIVNTSVFHNKEILLQKGKKYFVKIIIK